jgi:hypothetical protein
MLWIGERLSAVERACMRSVLAQGHRLTLYSYDPVAGVPNGVEQADAEAILPRNAIIAHRSGSLALFSDHFRFELQRRGLGIWLDCDVYLLAPLRPTPDGTLLGWLDPDTIGAGVLALPPHSPLIAPVLRLFEAPYVPDWLRWPDRLRAHLRRWHRGEVELAELPWGVAGPLALTALARRHGLAELALPSAVLYPWSWQQADWIFDPARSLAEFVTPETRAVHLYNYLIADRKELPALPGSFLARLQEEGA